MLDEYEKAKELVQDFEEWKTIRPFIPDPYSFDNFIKERALLIKAEVYDAVYQVAADEFQRDEAVGAVFRDVAGLNK